MIVSPPKAKPFSLALLISALCFQAQAATVSFDDAWQRVRNHNDELAAEKSNVEKAEHLQEASRALSLPRVTVSANYTYLDDPIQIAPSDIIASTPAGNSQAASMLLQSLHMTSAQLDKLFTSQLTNRDILTSSVRAVWPVFLGGRIMAAQDIAKGKTQEAKYMLEMKEHAKFEDLSNYYFGVVLAQQVLETRQEAEQGLEKHYKNALKMEAQGQIAKVERLQAQSSYDKARVERLKAQRNLEIAQVALTKMLKLQTPATPTTALFVNESLPDMMTFLNQTLSDYPGLHILDAKKRQASGALDVEKGKYYPEVFVYGNYNLYEEDTLAAKTAPDWAIGVGVSIPLLDSSGRSDKVKAAHSAMTQVNYLRAQAEQDLTVLVEKTYREASQALEEYEGLASSVALAEESVSLREKAFSQGLSTSLDVVDAELYLASVKTQRLSAAYHYVTALSRLLAVSGGINTFDDYENYKGLKVN
ncbi:TolC family protein [Photobacterium galatheae]|uniref:Membrane protein n=1 Tax=Photobacterium galatheae TaxID=1654360 RepID=A0A066RHV8_9GAMM|nr:TolC family protein [Photobacterium galatheae]KDM89914.1 membrane protein [Photobacterium galatheae]MCM0149750.1 TolC family protein [Photobacterium galatheae]